MTKLPISVVIASVGRDSVFEVVRTLLAGFAVPKEIIIVLPPGVFFSADVVANLAGSVKFFNSLEKGQTRQRCYGLSFVSQDVVLQLDDDICCPRDGLLNLYNELRHLGEDAIVGPLLDTTEPPRSESRLSKLSRVAGGGSRSFFSSIVSVRWISPWGVGYAFDNLIRSQVEEAGWLSGGAVLYYRERALLKNYYPFVGKAYLEDVIASAIWAESGARLYLCSHVKFATLEDKSSCDCMEDKSLVVRAAKLVCKLRGKNRVWGWVYEISISICNTPLFRFLF